ncbi:hypothetical protein K435DRAFT_965458 [Dendrothele bispora CBS 962.96]|uniref:Uncharacterized protein n=1 Tax=Dendrothele bispora (strain CBS 962.96) TaxID=1314807 RepID=A0A4S8M5L4_DENBC|nr:hypothetical protein K435DRAFT_965458 [Dendrothele bispora CBS 962.96]
MPAKNPPSSTGPSTKPSSARTDASNLEGRRLQVYFPGYLFGWYSRCEQVVGQQKQHPSGKAGRWSILRSLFLSVLSSFGISIDVMLLLCEEAATDVEERIWEQPVGRGGYNYPFVRFAFREYDLQHGKKLKLKLRQSDMSHVRFTSHVCILYAPKSFKAKTKS